VAPAFGAKNFVQKMRVLNVDEIDTCSLFSHLHAAARSNFLSFFSPNSETWYRAFHRFGQAKFPDGGSILGSSQFLILPQLPLKTMIGLKVVKIGSKINNSNC